MPDWDRLFGDTTLVQAILVILAIVFVVGAAVKLWPFIRNAVAIVDALVKLPALAQQVAEIHHETHRNDGSSIKDATVRIEQSLEGLHGRMDAVEVDVRALRQADDELWEQLESTNNPDSEEET